MREFDLPLPREPVELKLRTFSLGTDSEEGRAVYAQILNANPLVCGATEVMLCGLRCYVIEVTHHFHYKETVVEMRLAAVS